MIEPSRAPDTFDRSPHGRRYGRVAHRSDRKKCRLRTSGRSNERLRLPLPLVVMLSMTPGEYGEQVWSPMEVGVTHHFWQNFPLCGARINGRGVVHLKRWVRKEVNTPNGCYVCVLFTKGCIKPGRCDLFTVHIHTHKLTSF